MYRLRSGGSSGGGGGTTSLSTPRYQLAEHRYGREEMLALFDRNYKPPELLTTFPALYVEKTQLPLALVQMTEDETVIKHTYYILISQYNILMFEFTKNVIKVSMRSIDDSFFSIDIYSIFHVFLHKYVSCCFYQYYLEEINSFVL